MPVPVDLDLIEAARYLPKLATMIKREGPRERWVDYNWAAS